MTENSTEPDAPAVNEVADAEDLLDWSRERDGLMADAASDEEPETEEWKG